MLRLPRCKCAIVCFSHCLLAVILVASLALALSPLTYSQETTAAVQGYVKDSTGAVIAGAAVEIAGPALGSKKTETDSTGFYRFSSLPPRVYTLTVNAKGFRAVKRQDVSLDVGRLPNIDFSLEIGSVSETIEVHGEAPVVDVTQSKVAVTVTREDLSSLPISRSFQSVIPFAPGARQEPLQSARGNRTNPTLATLSTGSRLDGTPEYYVPAKDGRKVIEPGYEISGPAFNDRLWFYSSYIPSIDTTNRTTTFTAANPGPRRLSNTFLQHNAYNRLDFRALNALRLFAGWNYAYSRTQGQLGAPDSAYGQVNTGSSTVSHTFRSDHLTVK